MARYASCRVCNGMGVVYPRDRNGFQSSISRTCRACNGSGANTKFMVGNCARCGVEITYPSDSQYPPTYCKSCKERVKREKEEAKRARDAKWQETHCKNCGSTIKYNVDWARIPDLCPTCKERKRQEIEASKAKWKEKSCSKCGSTIKYNTDWTKIPNLCKSCQQKEREKWKEKSCSKCGQPIKYNTDWTKIPNLCKDCQQKERDKWVEKKCESCGKSFKINKDWDRPPRFCKECNVKVEYDCEVCGYHMKVTKADVITGDREEKLCRRCHEKHLGIWIFSLAPTSWGKPKPFDSGEKTGSIKTAIVYKGKGWRGADFRITLDNGHVVHYVDEGIPTSMSRYREITQREGFQLPNINCGADLERLRHRSPFDPIV